jgi:hypothetical protein
MLKPDATFEVIAIISPIAVGRSRGFVVEGD